MIEKPDTPDPIPVTPDKAPDPRAAEAGQKSERPPGELPDGYSLIVLVDRNGQNTRETKIKTVDLRHQILLEERGYEQIGVRPDGVLVFGPFYR